MENPTVQRLKNLLEDALMMSDIAWWDWDISNNRVVSNNLKTTMLGYEPDAFRGAGYQAYTDLLHPDDYDRTMQAMRDHLEGRADIYQIDYRIRRADGTYTWYMDRGCILERDEAGKPLRLRGLVVDLGEPMRDKARDEAILKLMRRRIPSSKNTEQFAVICSSCMQIKITESEWAPVDGNFRKVFLTEISHGLCPDCIKKLYPEMSANID